MDEGIIYFDLRVPVSSADENVTDPKNKRDPGTQCFSNPVIMDCLLEYLDHSSTKMFSQSCQSVLSLIRSNRAFIDKSIFCIMGKPSVYKSDWSLSEEPDVEPDEGILDLAFLENVNFPWTSLKVETECLDDVGIEIVKSLLSKVVRLELTKRAYNKGIEQFTDHILVAAQSLKELVIDQSYFGMTDVDRKMFRSDPKVQNIVENLDILHITSVKNIQGYYREYAFTLDESETVKAFLSMPKYLKGFSFVSEDYIEAEFEKSLLTLLRKHDNTLASLALHRWAWNTDDVLDLVCPNLKELNVRARGEDLPRVCRFIMKQGQLLKLDVNLDSGTILSTQPLVDTLILCGSQLITFSLAWKVDPPRAYPHVPGPSLDFSWVQKLSKLKSISIRQFTGRYGDSETLAPVSHILANLPAGIKIINFVGAHRHVLVEPERPKITQLMIEKFGQFRDLTVLNLLQCQDALNDDILLFISANLTHLRELGFSSSSTVTGVGFAGIGALKSLMKLKFYRCDGLLKRREIMLSFSFPVLKELHMDSGNDYMESLAGQEQREADADYFKAFISRNRMLEKLVLQYYQYRSTLGHVLTKYFGRIIRVEQMDSYDRGHSFRTLEDRRHDSDSDDCFDYNYQ